MKHFKLIMTLLVLQVIVYSSCKYSGYKETYNKNGVVILTKADSDSAAFALNKTTTSKTIMPFSLDVNPEDGEEIPDYRTAKSLIDLYQREESNDCKNTHYVDFYFLNLDEYLKKIARQTIPEELSKFGLRFYLSKTLVNHEFQNSIVVGPIYNTGRLDSNNREIVNPLWFSDPSNYKAFNFGSLCPKFCTNQDDRTGYKWPCP